MAELKLPRLLAAAKEFNIGQDTLIDFLIGKGFPKDDLKPTSKMTEEMYRALQNEFSSDKAAKIKSNAVDLPKGGIAEAKKKKEEEEIYFGKEGKKIVKQEQPIVPVEEVKPVIVKKEEPKPVEEITKIESPETPSIKSITNNPGTKYLALIGIGINISANSAFGTIKAKATKSP